jgi:hypothetical protein
MHKLNAGQLSGLGAPRGGGAPRIEAWLRGLLGPGAVRLPGGLVELRGPEPVVTTLGALKKACGVAVETVKQGLRALEMDHWVMLVDGAHTRLLGPPRFGISISKENLWGSVGGSVEISPAEGMNPLESIDYERLALPESVQDRKRVLTAERIELTWSARVRLANGREAALEEGSGFLLALGSLARSESGKSGTLARDTRVAAAGGRGLRLLEKTELRLEPGAPLQLEAGSLVELERGNVIRLPSGETGILSISPVAKTAQGEVIDWGSDSHWLGRFRRDAPLVLLRRTVSATLLDVVAPAEPPRTGEPARWNVVLGAHDCVLDGSVPFQAGRCAEKESPRRLLAFVRGLGEQDSLRARMSAEFGARVGSADVRVSATAFAPAYDLKLLRQAAPVPQLNSELLCVGNKSPCWTQVGAYYGEGDIFPWEVTREIYFTHVSLHYRQTAGKAK